MDKQLTTIEAFNDGFMMGVRHCEKYGLPPVLNDTVVEDKVGIPLPEDYIDTSEKELYAIDGKGNKFPLSDLYEKKYTQSEVDVMMEQVWNASRADDYSKSLGYLECKDGDTCEIFDLKYQTLQQFKATLPLQQVQEDKPFIWDDDLACTFATIRTTGL